MTPTDTAPPSQWWLAVDQQPDGPYSEDYVRLSLQAGRLSPDQFACPVGGDQWQPLRQWPAFASSTPPPVPAPLPQVENLLTNPRLPPMGNAVCVYAILVAPVSWCFDNFGCCLYGTTFHEESPLFDYEVMLLLISAVIGLGLTVLMVVGGIRLRQLRSSGVTFILTSFWAGVAAFVGQLVVTIGLMALAEETDFVQTTVAQDVITFFYLLLGLAELAFLIVAVVWLIRNRRALPLSE